MRITILGGLVLLLSSLYVQAIDLEDLQKAREEAQIIDQVTEIITTGNLNDRIKIFEKVMEGNDPVLRSIVMEAAISDKNDLMRTAAFRQLFTDHEQLLITVNLPDDPNPTQAWLHQGWSGLELFEMKIDKDALSGRFKTTEYNHSRDQFTGKIVRDGLQLKLVPYNRQHICNLITTEVSGTLIKGKLKCNLKRVLLKPGGVEDGVPSASLPITIRLS